MPYIKREARKHIDSALDALAVLTPGEITYAITLLIARLQPRDYAGLAQLVGVLECAKLEVYRRVIGPYEDSKIAEHGDIDWFFFYNWGRKELTHEQEQVRDEPAAWPPSPAPYSDPPGTCAVPDATGYAIHISGPTAGEDRGADGGTGPAAG